MPEFRWQKSLILEENIFKGRGGFDNFLKMSDKFCLSQEKIS